MNLMSNAPEFTSKFWGANQKPLRLLCLLYPTGIKWCLPEEAAGGLGSALKQKGPLHLIKRLTQRLIARAFAALTAPRAPTPVLTGSPERALQSLPPPLHSLFLLTLFIRTTRPTDLSVELAITRLSHNRLDTREGVPQQTYRIKGSMIRGDHGGSIMVGVLRQDCGVGLVNWRLKQGGMLGRLCREATGCANVVRSTKWRIHFTSSCAARFSGRIVRNLRKKSAP